MDARTSRYPEVYARAMRDPEGFWGEAAQAIDWYEPAQARVRSRCRRLRPLVHGRGVQHLLQRDRPPCGARARRSARDHLRLAGHEHQARHHLCGTAASEVATLAAVLQDFGVTKGDRVILYMPMVPEALFAMYACARIGAIHSVVFGGFAAKELATRLDDCKPKLILSASCGIEVARVVPYKPLLDAAIDLAKAKPQACLILQRPQCEAPLTAGRDHDWATPARQGARGEQDRALRAGAGDRSALHPLHVGHDRHSQRRGARQWRPHGRARLVDAKPLRRRARRGVLGGLRHRLGGRPQLHRLRAAVPRLHHDPLRGQTGRHAGRGRVLARHLRAQMRRDVHRADRVPRDQEGRPERQVLRAIRPVAFPHAVPRGRARRPGHDPVGREPAEGAGDRSLVADRDRLGDRRQSARPRHAAGEARLADGRDAGLRRAHRRRAVQGSGRPARWARSS